MRLSFRWKISVHARWNRGLHPPVLKPCRIAHRGLEKKKENYEHSCLREEVVNITCGVKGGRGENHKSDHLKNTWNREITEGVTYDVARDHMPDHLKNTWRGDLARTSWPWESWRTSWPKTRSISTPRLQPKCPDVTKISLEAPDLVQTRRKSDFHFTRKTC
jgi:hypothetical protein